MRDRPDDAPLLWIDLVAASDLFSVPRRFDLATVLVAMLGFALLFSGLRIYFDATPPVMAVIGGLFVTVAFGQWAAARRGRPRQASIVAAGIFWFALNLGLLYFGRRHAIDSVGVAAFTAVLYSIPSGYIVGTLVGGVFLVSHHLRERGALRRRDSANQPHADSPWDEPATDLATETPLESAN